MKAARKARQNTLGTARRKAHTPRHTQRRITAESTRRRLAPASLHAAQYLRYTRPAPPHRRESAHAATFVNSMPLLHACPAPTHRRKRTPRHTQRRITAESTRRRLAPASLHAAQYLRYTRPAPPHRRESAHAATFVNSMPLLHARRTFSAPARRDGRASEAPAIHSLPARTLRLYYSAFCVQMRDIILPRGALFHHFLNVYTKGRPAAAKDTPPGDRPRAFIRFCR